MFTSDEKRLLFKLLEQYGDSASSVRMRDRLASGGISLLDLQLFHKFARTCALESAVALDEEPADEIAYAHAKRKYLEYTQLSAKIDGLLDGALFCN